MAFQDWFAGQTREGLGLWSREHGPEAVETLPRDADSTARLGELVHERVIEPAVRATQLDGQRYWSTHQPPSASADGLAEAPVRVVAHVSPFGALAGV